MPLRRLVRRRRQLDAYRQAAAFAIECIDPPAMGFDRPSRNRQPESEAIAVARGAAGEGFEDAFPFARRQARSAILDADLDHVAPEARADLDRAARCGVP